MADVVQGFLFATAGEENSERNHTVCQIITRADDFLIANEATFVVRFGDGFEMIAYASELHPWFPTD